MSQQQIPLTAEVVFEMFRETDRRIAQMSQETAEQMKETDRKIGSLTSRIGEIVENMVGGDIVGQFQALNIAIHSHCRDKTFGTRGTSESGQIDVFLENGDIVVLIEVKTKLTDDDVREHIERLEKYRVMVKTNDVFLVLLLERSFRTMLSSLHTDKDYMSLSNPVKP